jgi:hypothetical protein
MKRVVITTGVLAIVGGAATILLMPSCDPDCEVQPKPSVILQIVAKQPKAVANDLVAEDVWYEHTNADGETTTKQAECMDDECTEWMLGDGSPGTYEYHATVCGHQYDASVTLEYNDDGCEVDTQMIELPVDSCADALAPEPPRPPQSGEPELGITQKTCTLEARPSVLVSVMGQVDSHLVPLPADRVFYEVHRPGEPSTGQMPGVCLNETCSMFAAGFEQTGSFEVGAEVCGEVITAKVRVDKTSNGCHVNTQQIQLMGDASKCKSPPVVTTIPPAECDGREKGPSAFVFPVTDGGDVWMPYPTENLYYVHEGTRHSAYCAETADNGKCRWWVVGWGDTGRFQAFTETCDVETAVSFSVEMSEDGCKPDTQFIPVFVDTHGCIRPAWPPNGNPPPTTPAITGEVHQ